MKKLKQPYTKEAKTKFIIDANNNGWVCKETETALYALEPWEELKGDEVIDNKEAWKKEQEQKERERISMLSLTKREVFLALFKAKGITPEQVKAQVTDTEALIELEYANEYYRGNPLIDLIGEKLGYTSDDLDYLFQNKELPKQEQTDDDDDADTDADADADPEVDAEPEVTDEDTAD